MKSDKSRLAFTHLELLLIVFVITILAGFLLPAFGPFYPPHASRIKCISNLKNVGLSFRIYATDNGDRFPGEILLSNGVAPAKISVLRLYLTISNELSTPKIVYCPDDVKRRPAESFTNLQMKNLSYFASLSASQTAPEVFLAGDRNLQTNGTAIASGLFALTSNAPVSFTAEIHKDQGNVAMGDGSVQQVSNARLVQCITDQGMATNYLVLP